MASYAPFTIGSVLSKQLSDHSPCDGFDSTLSSSGFQLRNWHLVGKRILMAQHKTAVTPLHQQWSHQSCAKLRIANIFLDCLVFLRQIISYRFHHLGNDIICKYTFYFALKSYAKVNSVMLVWFLHLPNHKQKWMMRWVDADITYPLCVNFIWIYVFVFWIISQCMCR